MQRLVIQTIFRVKNLKNIPSEQWIQKPEDASVKWADADKSHLNIKFYRQIKRQFDNKLPEQVAIQPLSPVLGPITVENPKIHDKIYRWCACGQSLKQPFCDGSHSGTSFKPFKFTVQQSVDQINLCGCKLTTKRPFCDGESCKVAQQDQITRRQA